MMEEWNHEMTGHAMGASGPDTVYDAVVPGDPPQVSPTGTSVMAPSAASGPASDGRRLRRHRFGVCHRCGWKGLVSRVGREDHRQIGMGRAFGRLCDDCFDALLGAPLAEGDSRDSFRKGRAECRDCSRPWHPPPAGRSRLRRPPPSMITDDDGFA